MPEMMGLNGLDGNLSPSPHRRRNTTCRWRMIMWQEHQAHSTQKHKTELLRLQYQMSSERMDLGWHLELWQLSPWDSGQIVLSPSPVISRQQSTIRRLPLESYRRFQMAKYGSIPQIKAPMQSTVKFVTLQAIK